MTGPTDRCLVQVREHPKAPWRTVVPSCTAAEAPHRAAELARFGHVYAVRVMHDGHKLFELTTPAPADDGVVCPPQS